MKAVKSSLVIGALLLFVSMFPILSFGQGEGTIKGRVLHKTGEEQTVPDVKVTLRKFVGQTQEEDVSTTTDDAGNYEFKKLTTRENETYYSILEYEGVEYFSDPLVFKDEKEKTADISVYNPTDSNEEVKLKLHHIVMDMPESGHLHVTEILLFENSGDTSFVGLKEVEQGKKETLKFSLPRGAQEFKQEQGLFDAYVVHAADTITDTMPVIPGQRQVVYSYKLTTGSSSFQFKRPVDYETPEFSMLVANKGLKVSTAQLASQGTSEGEQGQEYLHFAGQNLKPNSSIDVEISNIPSGQGVFQWIAYVLVALLVLGGLSFPFFRKVLRREKTVAEEQPQDAPERVTPPVDGLEQQRETLLSAIAALDDQFETGKISSEEYESKRAERKRELLKITEEIRQKQ